MNVTMGIEVEHKITQPESQLAVMETCYEEPTLEETYMTEEVHTRSQAQKQSQQHQWKSASVLEASVCGTEELLGKSKLQQVRFWIRLQVSIQYMEQPRLW